MEPKPKQWGVEYGAIFHDESVVAVYHLRPPYPPQTFAILLTLLPAAGPNIVLDVGCGSGTIARGLLAAVDHADAVDSSAAMIAKGRTLPGGDNPKLRWICSPIETADLLPTYGLIVAAASMHWLDWPVVLPRFAKHLAADGYLALVETTSTPQPWHAAVANVLARFSLNQDFQPYNMQTVAQELAKRGLFQPVGEQSTPRMLFRQSIAEWVDHIHAGNGFSRDRMTPQVALTCDAELTRIMECYCPHGVVEQHIGARVIWGKPRAWVVQT
jgi:SAM-dependent methyltransferase